MTAVFGMLAAFQVKHFLADYPLQRPYMLRKFAPGWEFVGPLTAHCAVHATFTFMLAVAFGRFDIAWELAAFDFTIHFLMDRLKASPKYLGRYKADQPYFWWALGFDQMIHHLTDLAIVWVIVSGAQ